MNNKKNAFKINTILSLSWLIILANFAGSFFVDFELRTILQINLGVFLVLIALTYSLGGFYYLEISIENNSILVIKHFNIFPLLRNFNLYKIPIKSLHKVKVKNYIFGVFTFISLYEKSQKGISRYPRIGLSAISRQQRKELIELFKKLSENK